MKSKTMDENQNEKSHGVHLTNETQVQRRQSLEDIDDTSSSGTLSDDDDDDEGSSDDIEDEGEDTCPPKSIITKPLINHELKSRLSTFLPQMQKANRDLEDAGDVLVNQVEDVGEDEDHYIEMNLGLGVLSERESSNEVRANTSDSDHDSSDGSTPTEDILQNLKNVKKRNVKRKVQEL